MDMWLTYILKKMKKKVRIVKKLFTLLLIFLLSINTFAAIVSDNDGSAFITKAEFDAMKSSFQSQIDSYNQSIDSKIDGAIASYLAGIKLATQEQIKCIVSEDKKYALYGKDDLPSMNASVYDFGDWVENTCFFFAMIKANSGYLTYMGPNGGWSRDASAKPLVLTDSMIHSDNSLNVGDQNIAWTIKDKFGTDNIYYLDNLADVNTITMYRAGGVRPYYTIVWGSAIGDRTDNIFDDAHGSKIGCNMQDPPRYVANTGTTYTQYNNTTGNFVHNYTLESCIDSWSSTQQAQASATISWSRLESGRFPYPALFTKKFDLPTNAWNSDGLLDCEYGTGSTDYIRCWTTLFLQGAATDLPDNPNVYYAVCVNTHIGKCRVSQTSNSTLYNQTLTTLVNAKTRTTDGLPLYDVKKTGLLKMKVKRTVLNSTADAEIFISDGPFGVNGLDGGNKLLMSLNNDMSGATTALTIPADTWTDVYIKFETIPTDKLYFQGHCKTSTTDQGAIFEFKDAILTVEN